MRLRFPCAVRSLVLVASLCGAYQVESAHGQTAATLFTRQSQHGDSSLVVDPAPLKRIDQLILDAIAARQIPGCVVEIGVSDAMVYRAAYGQRQVEPSAEAMTFDTLFDLASLTKPVATASAVMLLDQQGKLDVNACAVEYIPEFAPQGKDTITLRQLLTHTSGLTPDNALSDYGQGVEESWNRICGLHPLSPPGTKFRYSDVGFIVLGKIVERVTGESLDVWVEREVFQKLAMKETEFTPSEDLFARCATTEKVDGEWLRGRVHDPRAARLGGVAGHAGLFSSLDDLVLFARMLVREQDATASPLFSRETVNKFTSAIEVPGGERSLGWDMRTGYSTQRSRHFSDNAFGHGGFTGTVLWIDPRDSFYIVLLSNRVHPDGTGSVNKLAGEIATLASEALGIGSP